MSGPSKSWSAQEEARLRALYPHRPQRETAQLLGRTLNSIASRAKVLKIKRIRNYQPWTPADDAILRAQYPHRSTKDIAAELGRTFYVVYQRAAKLGLKKTAEYLASPAACRLRRGDKVGKAFRNQKSHIPANKGLRRPGYAPGRMATTQFKKGQVSHNTMPLWSFRWVDGYLMLKTGAPTPKPTNGWEYVHKLIWEQAHGPLPSWREARLWWRDGDHGNCTLANLELVTAAEHMRRTTVHNLPPELKQVVMLGGVLKRKIRERRQGANEKQDVRSA